jgi:hypothetical protein
MKTGLVFILLFINHISFNKNIGSTENSASDSSDKKNFQDENKEKLKFVILCFRLSAPYNDEVSSLNKLAKEYDKYVTSVVIKDDELIKYKELFTKNEFQSLQDFIKNKTEYQKYVTSFPVILILDRNGKIKNAWSGDKTDGLKKDEFYTKIKVGLEAIVKEY